MNDMSAIAAAAMRIRTMADGSLRIECEVEPSAAQAAFALFGRPGTPMALAALRPGYAAASNEPEPEPEYSTEKKGGYTRGGLARLAAIWCNSDHFQGWLKQHMPSLWTEIEDTLGHPENQSETAAEVIRQACGVESRADLDNNEMAARIFNDQVRNPYREALDAKR